MHRILLQRVPNLVNKLAILLHKRWLREDSWDKPKNDGCRGRRVSAFSQSGRSMIEMLGVLAIIGVLSVGGIAGYSKAMSMWRINKSIDEYSYFITGLLEYKDNLMKNADTSNANNNQVPIIEFAEAANLMPTTWKQISNIYVMDTFGHIIKPYVNPANKRLAIDIYMTASSTSSSTTETVQFCTYLFTNIAQPLSNILSSVTTQSSSGNSYTSYLKGNKHCNSGENCLQNATLSDLQSACLKCVQTSDSQCGFIMAFD